MLLRFIRHVSVFIVLVLCQELTSCEPIRTSPLGKEIELEEGQALSIQCNGKTLLKFVYPDSLRNSINRSNYEISYKTVDGLYYYVFNRPNTVFSDTGWYGCANHNFLSSTKSSDTEIDWFYVYVKSNTNLFVETNTNVHLSATAGGSVVIPCRTTLPDLKPILINGNEDELNEVSFDPKIGFTKRNLSMEDSNLYKCSIEKDGEEHAVSYVLSVLKQALPVSKFQANDLFITRGQDLNINCTVEMKLSMDCEFDWIMPQKKNSSRNIQQFIEHLDGNTALVKSILTILNVTDEDAGDYKCVVRSTYDIKEIRKNIKIHDRRTKLIKLYLVSNTSNPVERGISILWIVKVNTLVEPYLQWFKPDGNQLISNKYTFIHETFRYNSTKKEFEMFSYVYINSLSEEDSGNYVFQAKKDYIIEKMNFTLNVIGKPIIKQTYFHPYYTFNESTEFRCEIISNPPPRISVMYLKYPYYPVPVDVSIMYLNVTQSAAYNSSYKFMAIVKTSTDMSGKILWEACNEVGCSIENGEVIVSAPVPPFFIKTNLNKTKTRTVAEGHNTMILQCFVDGMPKPTVTWYKDKILLKENNQYFFKNNTQELHIRYLMLQDTGNYSCQANNSVNMNETYQQITVKNRMWNTLDTALVTSILILSFILIILAISFTIKIHREKKIRRNLMEIGLMNFEEGVLECLNPNLTVDDQAELLPYDKKWEFPRDRIILKEQLGSGHFGMVMKAEAIGIRRKENITTVAVKMVRRTSNPIYIRALASELKIMVHLGKHLNVVNLLGAYTKNIFKFELLVIVEYCHFGNLHNYLSRHRNDFINQINLKTGKHDFTIGLDVLTRTVNVSNDISLHTNSGIDTITNYNPETNLDSPQTNSLPDYVLSSSLSQSESGPNYCYNNKNHNPKPICTKDLLSWTFQVARGMEYLSQRKILHGDLAARNILLTEDNVVKICDFGLAKTMYKNGNYKKKSNDPVPIKWMAIESIRDQIFSTQSDVWSFGIMLWEFFTLAKTPYPGMEVKEQYKKLIEGYRLERPDYAIDEIYDIMLQCWIAKPTLRPSFTDLVENIGNLLEESVRMHYITLNNSYMEINTMNLENGKKDYLMMMSAPDHAVLSSPTNKCVNPLFLNETSDSSDLYISSGCPTDESKIFIPLLDSNIDVPSSTSDFENAIDLSSMLKREEDPYLKPINVHERRTEFVRQGEVIKNKMADKLIDENSVYYNVLRKSLHRSEHHEQE